MTLLFCRTGDVPVHSAGAIVSVQIAGGLLRIGPDARELAHYRGGYWWVNGQDVPKIHVTGSGPLLLEAKQPEGTLALGEFAQLEFIDGALYSGGVLLARLDVSAGAWYFYSDARLHSVLLLAESNSSGRVTTDSPRRRYMPAGPERH